MWLVYAVMLAKGVSLVLVDAAEARLSPPHFPARLSVVSMGTA